MREEEGSGRVGSSPQDKGGVSGSSSTSSSPGMQDPRLGGWGARGCLAAEVRPYSELAASLSSSLVRVRGGGKGGSKGRRRSGSCRRQWEDSP